MPLLPAAVLDRKLTWDDFQKSDQDEPEPGESKISALTASDISGSDVEIQYLEDKKIYKVTEATVTVNMDSATSWVARYVLTKWSKEKNDNLLGHEQIHFMITAVSGRDYQTDLDAIHAKDYKAGKTAKAELMAVINNYTKPILQGIHRKYDKDTKSDPTANAAIQAKWTNAVEDARKNNKKLRPTLKTAGLIP